ncbi:leucine-rich repeat and calponin homology domain-containing protein 1 [Trichonephila clavata]|uniref:Leucine-rich repeat and calponin homology domain-containing protein 1 n=1 Tax=Trichonephila clavata TaxID=2740835 RepID=A0A8X6M5D3_TRICU|nr:leucine-rich repeat and calponin homology domain-containing protein 1 [Trichonephila clavata]
MNSCHQQKLFLNSTQLLPRSQGVELSPKLQVSKTKSVVASKQTLRRNEIPPVEEVPRGNGIPLVNTSVEIMPKNTHTENDQVCFAEKKVLKLEEISSVPSNKDSNQGNFAWPKNSLSVVKPSKSSFTMRRELDKAREEQELISQLREILESRLKLKLPVDLESALNDGVFLCHLANNIRANSVTCIHVPSPTVPKLTVAKCRRNADNFLEACRRLGVPNDLLCSPQDILGEQGGLIQSCGFSYDARHYATIALNKPFSMCWIKTSFVMKISYCSHAYLKKSQQCLHLNLMEILAPFKQSSHLVIQLLLKCTKRKFK